MISTEANSSRDEDVHFPTKPSEDWAMNVFLNELADEITADDLKKMKHLLTGLNGTGKGVLEEIKDPLDLFQHLRQRRILTRDNIVYLQAMLWHTRRKDLHNKFVKFAKGRGNIIHFYSPSDQPENGYEYIKFHIAGREKMNRHKLEELRMHVSNALCVPPEFIIASGIEATNSILVTFMVPIGYAHALLDLDNNDKAYLGERGIDAIWYNGKLISCIDVEITEQEEAIKKDEEVKILLEQKSKLDKEVESLQKQLLIQDKIMRQCQKHSEKIQAEAAIRVTDVTCRLIRQYIDIKFSPQKMSLMEIAHVNAVRYFKYILKKMENSGHDVDLIRHLLEANRMVTLITEKSEHAWLTKQLSQKIAKLEHDNIKLSFEKDKLAYYLRVGVSDPILTQNEEFFVQHCWKVPESRMPIINQTTQVSITVPEVQLENIHPETMQDVLTKIFKEWESSLSEKEKQILAKKFLFSTTSQKSFKESKCLLLEYLWGTYSKSKEGADFQEWIVIILAEIKRMDLYAVWMERSAFIIKAMMVDEQEADDSEDKTTTSQANAGFYRQAGYATNRSNRHSKRKHPAVEEKPVFPVMEVIKECLQRIEEKTDRHMKMTERVFVRGDSLSGKSDTELLYDFSKIYQSKLLTKI